ncbi:DsrE/DsrF-like family protein [Nanobdella aerobiophila]|uniref:DsrE/DsrF-like family protein n=1 Tax=Nanobdella aerobiophila TaxID=2586965 RepID=A0A915WRF6_9ARCH|nr:DsrE family protein [Nanobdella aerobiophila]BBL45558.1 DsrE/DsrF-like family protein [Nanobdella aerobiophila]
MVKFLIVLKSSDHLDIKTGLNIAINLKINGAEDVKVLYLGPAISFLTKKLENEQFNEQINKIKNNNIKLYACQKSMENYGISKDNLIYVDEVNIGSKLMLDYSEKEYKILIF